MNSGIAITNAITAGIRLPQDPSPHPLTVSNTESFYLGHPEDVGSTAL